ncbi:MAG: hypothetical protein HFI43_08200 [Lachnospiraceae bacterium]|jgi:hypothetical protein|nr:hypothetical protein [Lachnospiraceae bacterium]
MKKATICVLSALAGALAGAGAAGKEVGDRANKFQMMSEKHLSLYLMMNQWVRIKQEGKHLSAFFEKNGYKNIAIYGMSYAGETLLDELKESGITVAYGIDKNADSIYADVDVVSGDDVLEPVDAVVVTAITFFDEIEQNLSEKVTCPVISLEDVLYGV